MYHSNNVFYSEEHTISFGELIKKTSGGIPYTDFEVIANTWDDWHLIPSPVPIVVSPKVTTKYVEIPGADDAVDFTEYLAGRPVYGRRQGSFSFYVDTNQASSETVHNRVKSVLHGKKMKMRVMDDASYYYEGRFTVGNVDSSSAYSKITINYDLNTYKYRIEPYGSEPMIWDTFNFETDYDYSVMYPNVTVSNSTKRFYLTSENLNIAPTAEWVSGTVTVSFGGISKTLNRAEKVTLGSIYNQEGTLVVSGNGSVIIEWRGGGL